MLVVLLFLGGQVFADDSVVSALPVEALIEEADRYWDGGTFAFLLRGNNGVSARVYLYSRHRSDKRIAGRFGVYSDNDEKKLLLAPDSVGGKLLVEELRKACIRSFGTADPERLIEKGVKREKRDFWNRFTMRRFLTSFPAETTPSPNDEQ